MRTGYLNIKDSSPLPPVKGGGTIEYLMFNIYKIIWITIFFQKFHQVIPTRDSAKKITHKKWITNKMHKQF